MAKKTIKVLVASREGHTELEFAQPQEAIEAMKDQESKGNWVYVNSIHRSTDTLSEAEVASANDIKVVPRLIGG